MSGASEFFVPLSEFDLPAFSGGGPSFDFWRGVPLPGTVAFFGAMAAIAGQADCRNLAANSPPTLLEHYEIYSYTIGFGGQIVTNAPRTPNVTAELALLVNDRVRYITQQTVEAQGPATNINVLTAWNFAGAWVADLQNPIILGARDRLSLRVGVQGDTGLRSGSGTNGIVVGAQVSPNFSTPIPFESTISYRVVDLPGARTL